MLRLQLLVLLLRSSHLLLDQVLLDLHHLLVMVMLHRHGLLVHLHLVLLVLLLLSGRHAGQLRLLESQDCIRVHDHLQILLLLRNWLGRHLVTGSIDCILLLARVVVLRSRSGALLRRLRWLLPDAAIVLRGRLWAWWACLMTICLSHHLKVMFLDAAG